MVVIITGIDLTRAKVKATGSSMAGSNSMASSITKAMVAEVEVITIVGEAEVISEEEAKVMPRTRADCLMLMASLR